MKLKYYYLVFCLFIYIGLLKFIHGEIQKNNENIRALALTEDKGIIPKRRADAPDIELKKDNELITSNIQSSHPIESSSPNSDEIIFTDGNSDSSTTSFKSTESVESTVNTYFSTIPDTTDISTYSPKPTNIQSTEYDSFSSTNGFPTTENTEMPTTISISSTIIEPISSYFFSDYSTNIEDTTASTYNPTTNIDTIFTSTYYGPEPSNSNTEITTSIDITSTVFNNESTIPTTSTNDINNETYLTYIPDITDLSSLITTIDSTELVNTPIYLVLLGFSHFKKSDSYLSFYIYFFCKEGEVNSKNLKFRMQITYNDNNKFLRLLKEEEINCNRTDILYQKISFSCSIEVETKNINSIKIIPDFDFISQESTVEISPFSFTYLDNIDKIGNQFDILLNASLYILSHTKINAFNNTNIFNISGVINEPNHKFKKNELSLIAYIESQKGNEVSELSCNIMDIIIDNYIIRCRANLNKTYNLHNSMSIIENEILLVNFDSVKDSIIFIPDTKELNANPVFVVVIILIFFGYIIYKLLIY